MFETQGGMMLVRAELCDRLERIARMATRSGTRDIVHHVGTIRTMAAAYGLVPVARLAAALERALGEGCGAATSRLYLDRLRDAIGCERLDEEASQALIASVSVRMG